MRRSERRFGRCGVQSLGMDNLNQLIYHFDSCIQEVIQEGEERSSKNEDLLERLNICNVKRTIEDIRNQSHTLKTMENKGQIKIVGANYCVESGTVNWI